MSPVPAAVTRQALTATLGAVAGVGLGVGALAWVRGEQMAPRDDAGTRAAFEQFAADGPVSGTWELTAQDHPARRLRFQPDPSRPGSMLVTDTQSAEQIPRAIPTDLISKRLAGDADLFFDGYVPAGPPAIETRGDHRELALSYRRKDCSACPRRTIYMDLVGRYVTGVEDRTYDGMLVQSAVLKSKDAVAARPVPRVRPGPVTRPTFREWAAMQTIPVYEPTRMPERFRLVDWESLEMGKKDGSVRVRPLALSYGDGLARMVILIASTQDMRELDDLAREYQKSGPSTCPVTPSNTPEEDVGVAHILRRKDPCRTTLRREDLPSVVVMLVGFNEIPDHLYVETMQSLVLVSK